MQPAQQDLQVQPAQQDLRVLQAQRGRLVLQGQQANKAYKVKQDQPVPLGRPEQWGPADQLAWLYPGTLPRVTRQALS